MHRTHIPSWITENKTGNIQGHSRHHYCCGHARSFKHYVCVCVCVCVCIFALDILHTKSMRRTVICDLPGFTTFIFHIMPYTARFSGKKSYWA
jgi:hypothetical protein